MEPDGSSPGNWVICLLTHSVRGDPPSRAAPLCRDRDVVKLSLIPPPPHFPWLLRTNRGRHVDQRTSSPRRCGGWIYPLGYFHPYHNRACGGAASSIRLRPLSRSGLRRAGRPHPPPHRRPLCPSASAEKPAPPARSSAGRLAPTAVLRSFSSFPSPISSPLVLDPGSRYQRS